MRSQWVKLKHVGICKANVIFIIGNQKMNGESYIGSEGNSVEATRHKLMMERRDECRICLESRDQEQNYNKMISPCKCTGSLKHVHQSCLEKWISNIVNRSHMKIASGKAHIFCEICKSKIYFKTAKALTCKSKSQIIEGFQENLKTFILLMLLLLINLGFFSALLNYLLFVGFPILQSNNAVLVSLIIAGQVIFSIVSVVTLACIVNKYFLSRKYMILEIVNLEETRIATEPPNAQPVMDSQAENNEKIAQGEGK